jgi:hypothetical protein
MAKFQTTPPLTEALFTVARCFSDGTAGMTGSRSAIVRGPVRTDIGFLGFSHRFGVWNLAFGVSPEFWRLGFGVWSFVP